MDSKYEKAKALVAGGSRVSEACSKVGIRPSFWYYHHKKESGVVKKSKKPTFIDVAPAQESVTIIVCQPSQIKSILAGLQ